MTQQQCEIVGQAVANKEQSSCWLMDFSIYEPMFNANMATAISYFVISFILLLMLYVSRNLIGWIGKSILLSFMAFILLCGIGHYVKVMNFWWGDFQLELFIDQLTAWVSVFTALYITVGGVYAFVQYIKHPDVFETKMRELFVLIGALEVLKNKREKTRAQLIKKINIKHSDESQFISYQTIKDSFPVGQKVETQHLKTVQCIDYVEDDIMELILLKCYMPIGTHYSFNEHDCEELIFPISGEAQETYADVPLVHSVLMRLKEMQTHGFKAKSEFYFYSFIIKYKTNE